MPYVSQAQQRFFHSPGAAKAGLTKADVKHWDEASRGQHGMPQHVAKKKHAAFVDEMLEIMAEKSASLEATVLRFEAGPKVHQKIERTEEKAKHLGHKIDRLMSKGDRMESPSYIERMPS
jgi:hypothetical protein